MSDDARPPGPEAADLPPAHTAASTLPPPPPPPPPPPASTVASPGSDRDEYARAGELTPGWRWVVRAAWLGAFVGYSSVWKASRDIGLPTWWLGQFGNPEPFYVTLLPFLAPAIMVVLSFGRSRALPWLGLGASALGAAIGAIDLTRYSGLGVVELLIAGAVAAVSLASFSGRYRGTAR
ncbi:MAG: hypothetical protein H0V69_03390 [Acidimicrobiia bacterium]|nr:hypothetical protein [Acidimicrobiia bacterium]MDQ3391918.1 hypothetical protein [Actinomycetota bacterium]